MVIDSSDDEVFECTSETTPEIRDIDTDSGILYVSEYASEIFQYLKQAEVWLFKFIIGSNKDIRLSGLKYFQNLSVTPFSIFHFQQLNWALISEKQLLRLATKYSCSDKNLTLCEMVLVPLVL